MALEKEISTSYGLKGNYIRVKEVTAYNGGDSAVVKIQVWASQDARSIQGAIPFEEYNVDILLSGQGSIFEQAYSGLKSLGDFSDAEDV